MQIKQVFISCITLLSFSAAFALVPNHPPKKIIHQPGEKIIAKTKSPFAIVAPGTHLYQSEENQNEFYILGKNDPVPVKPKPIVAAKKVKKIKIAKVHKVHVYKVAVKKSTHLSAPIKAIVKN